MLTTTIEKAFTVLDLQPRLYEDFGVESCQHACANQKVAENLASNIISVDGIVRILQIYDDARWRLKRADVCLGSWKSS